MHVRDGDNAAHRMHFGKSSARTALRFRPLSTPLLFPMLGRTDTRFASDKITMSTTVRTGESRSFRRTNFAVSGASAIVFISIRIVMVSAGHKLDTRIYSAADLNLKLFEFIGFLRDDVFARYNHMLFYEYALRVNMHFAHIFYFSLTKSFFFLYLYYSYFHNLVVSKYYLDDRCCVFVETVSIWRCTRSFVENVFTCAKFNATL